MTQDEIVEMAIQGHASTRDAIRWAINQERENNVILLMRLADVYEHADKQGSADDIYKIVDHIRARGKA